MEKRTLLAVVLSLFILLGWSYFFQQKPVTQKPLTAEQPQVKPETAHTPEQVPAVQPSVGLAETKGIEAKDILVETDLYKAVLSTAGAGIKSWELKTYNDDKKMPVMLLQKPGTIQALGIMFEDAKQAPQPKYIYEVNTDSLTLAKGSDRGELVFTYSSNVMSIKKKFTFYNDDFRADLSIETANVPAYLLPVGTDFGVYDKKQSEHKGPVILIDSDRKEFDDKQSQRQDLSGYIRWIAQEDKYFTAALMPVSQNDGAVVWKEGASAEIAFRVKQQKQDFVFYAGPKEYDRLKKLNQGLEHIIDFGWFSIVAMPLFWVLKYIHSFTGNYGWAIILVTIAVRIPFILILNKSQQSMKKLQKIQPMMNDIKEKYKKDPQRMQKEMMALYKTHKVNPVGGCLPMFLQIPVFVALYNVLAKAIELRGAPFALWITDLAVKDPYYIMPITMGATMVIQQKMTPSTMDPTQAKMMMLMPIVFTFMFLSFPSGLVLYWLVNNVLGIIQQYYTNKKAD